MRSDELVRMLLKAGRYGFVCGLFLALAWVVPELGGPCLLLSLLIPLGMMIHDGLSPLLWRGALMGALLGSGVTGLLSWMAQAEPGWLFVLGVGCLLGAPLGAFGAGMFGERPLPQPSSGADLAPITWVRAIALFLLFCSVVGIWSWYSQLTLKRAFREQLVPAERLSSLPNGQESVFLATVLRENPGFAFQLAAYDRYEDIPGKLDQSAHEEFREARHPALKLRAGTSGPGVTLAGDYQLSLMNFGPISHPPDRYYGVRLGEEVAVHGWIHREPQGIAVARATVYPGDFLAESWARTLWVASAGLLAALSCLALVWPAPFLTWTARFARQ